MLIDLRTDRQRFTARFYHWVGGPGALTLGSAILLVGAFSVGLQSAECRS